jgi:uncharacterized damage-inducible protein DinB
MSETTFARAFNTRVKNMLLRVVEDLSDEQIHYSAPAIDKRSIANVVIHGYGSVVGVALLMTGTTDFRQAMAPPQIETAQELIEQINRMHERVEQVLASLPEDALAQQVRLPMGREMVGSDAYAWAAAHSIFHAGAIQGIRAIGGFPTPPES